MIFVLFPSAKLSTMSPLSRGLLLASQLASHFAESTITNTKSTAQSASIALYSSSKPIRIA